MALPSAFDFCKMMYWSLRRDRRNLIHLPRVIIHFFGTYTLLLGWRLRHWRRPIVMIAQIERMGDIIASEPISRAARERYPDALIVWVAHKNFHGIVSMFGAVDKVVGVMCLTEWMLVLVARPKAIIWDLHIPGYHCSRCMAPLPKADLAGKLSYETYYDYRNLLTVACLSAGIPAVTGTPVLLRNPVMERAIDRLGLPKQFVLLHCESRDQHRNWTTEKWQTLATLISEKFHTPVVEIGLKPMLRAAPSVIDLCGKMSIPETAEVIRRASLFVGLDSGPAHIANATGVGGVILMGRFHRWDNHMPFSGPYETGDKATIVRTSGALADLPVDTVLEAVGRQLAKETHDLHVTTGGGSLGSDANGLTHSLSDVTAAL